MTIKANWRFHPSRKNTWLRHRWKQTTVQKLPKLSSKQTASVIGVCATWDEEVTYLLRGLRRGLRRSPSSSFSSPRRRGPVPARRRSSLRSCSCTSSTTASRGTQSSSSIVLGVCGAPIRRWRWRHHKTHQLMLSRILDSHDAVSRNSLSGFATGNYRSQLAV